ncbi:MAG: tyrosine-type recombinase/integrase [Flavobacteriales bacterium]|nr:tyrosine-type recombinase/integrase [Flavobacteriales bacterium]
MSSSIKVIFRKISKDDTLGYLFLQRVENRKSSVRSLKLPPLDIKYWDKVKQRVKKSVKIDYQGYNDTIEQHLSVVLADGRSFDTYDGANSKASFLAFYQGYLNSAKLKDKTGTRIKLQTVYKKLKKFLASESKTDLLFSELTQDFLDQFRFYMKKGGMESNTATHYLKILQVIYGHAKKDKSVIVGNNPFYSYDYGRKQPKRKESLYRDDITKLIDSKIDIPRLSKARDLFLFQFFTGGMRVSDLVTLRYGNLHNGRIVYNMFKTNAIVDIAITDIILDLLKRLLGLEVDVNAPIEAQADVSALQQERLRLLQQMQYGMLPTPPYGFPDELIGNVPLSVAIDKSYWLHSAKVIMSMTLEELKTELGCLCKFVESEGRITYSLYKFDFSSLYANYELFYKSLVTQIKTRIAELNRIHFDNSVGVINEFATNERTSTRFVFGMLKDSDFANVGKQNDFSIIDEQQYLKVTKAGIVYNRHLKQLQKHIGIDRTFSTHLPRTSFANIMMNSGASTMDVSKAMAHSSLGVTDAYLKTGFNDGRTDSVLKALGDQFDL